MKIYLCNDCKVPHHWSATKVPTAYDVKMHIGTIEVAECWRVTLRKRNPGIDLGADA